MSFLTTFVEKTFRIALDDMDCTVLPLRRFLLLELKKKNLDKAIKARDRNAIVTCLQEVLHLQTNKSEFEKYTPTQILKSVLQIIFHNRIRSDAVFLIPSPNHDKKPTEKHRYDFEGRIFTQWVDLLASNYGWSEESILEMSVDRVTYYIQEIMVRLHAEKEWSYRLSELAYKYDPGSKKSKYVPLEKPYWMKDEIDGTVKKTKIPYKLLPAGVINISGYDTVSKEEADTQNN